MAKYFEEVAATVTLETAKDLEKYFEFAKTNRKLHTERELQKKAAYGTCAIS